MMSATGGDFPFTSISSILLLTLPTLNFLYSAAVWFNYSYYHECQWGDKVPGLMTRLAVLVAAVTASDNIALRPEEHHHQWLMILSAALILSSISVYQMRQTRRVDVVGMAPPIYGKDHMRGKTVVITGSNTGIGKETAFLIAEMGATVVMACRSEARAKQAMDDLQAKSTQKLDLQFCQLDLGDLASVRKAAASLKGETIHVLIQNAGVMMGSRTEASNGKELMMQANHLGHFLFAKLLLPQMPKDGRIINLTSSTYQFAKKGFDFDDMFCEKKSYSMFPQYAQTKLANILHIKELETKVSPQFLVYAVHPGIVRTDVTRQFPWYLKYPNMIFAVFVSTIQKTPKEGAYSSVVCAVSPNPPPTGSYVVNGKAHPVLPCAESKEVSFFWSDLAFQIVAAT
jgi:retinol dehydrogenase 12